MIWRNPLIKTANFLALLLFGTLAFGFAGKAAATSHIKSTVTTEATYLASSDQARQVKEWLLQHAVYVNGAMVGDPNKLGNVQVIHSYTSRSAAGSMQQPMDINGPPVSLPLSGNPGDVISITSTSGGVTQTWTYTWVGNPTMGNWHLTKYTYEENNPPTEPK